MIKAMRHRAGLAASVALLVFSAPFLLSRGEVLQHATEPQLVAQESSDLPADHAIVLPDEFVNHVKGKVIANTHEAPPVLPRAQPAQPVTIASTQEQGILNLELQACSTEQADLLLRQKGRLPSGHTIASPWTDPAALSQNGWTCKSSPEVKDFGSQSPVPIKGILLSLGLSVEFAQTDNLQDTTQGRNHAITCSHDTPYMIEGQKFAVRTLPYPREMVTPKLTDQSQPTGALYKAVLNPSQGVLIAYGGQNTVLLRLPSPPETDRNRPSPGEILAKPPLGDWDDVVALEVRGLSRRKGSSRENFHPRTKERKLRYISRLDADLVGQMPELVEEILQSLRERMPCERITMGRGQGQDLTRGMVEFNAVVGSPLGEWVSRLLYRHKEMWGLKRMKRIIMFHDDRLENAQLAFMFELEDLESPTGYLQE